MCTMEYNILVPRSMLFSATLFFPAYKLQDVDLISVKHMFKSISAVIVNGCTGTQVSNGRKGVPESTLISCSMCNVGCRFSNFCWQEYYNSSSCGMPALKCGFMPHGT